METINSEYWDLFDENRNYVGITHLRGAHIPNGLYHLVVHSWIMDENGNFLISRRQKGRTDELKWERTGGSVIAGESSLEGALREVKEELGIDLSKSMYFFIKSVKRNKYHDFFDSWLFIVERSKIFPEINKNEVFEYKWVSYYELMEMKSANKLVDSSQYIDEVYKAFKEHISEMVF